MDFKNIKIRIEESIGFVQIERPADKNSLNIETSKEILQALKDFDQDNVVKCIAIEGNEKLFSPGADIKELQNLTKNKASEQKLFDAFDEIYNIKKPVIALVEGYALGGGMELDDDGEGQTAVKGTEPKNGIDHRMKAASRKERRIGVGRSAEFDRTSLRRHDPDQVRRV
jgi:hypothetical protein